MPGEKDQTKAKNVEREPITSFKQVTRGMLDDEAGSHYVEHSPEDDAFHEACACCGKPLCGAKSDDLNFPAMTAVPEIVNCQACLKIRLEETGWTAF